MKSITTKYSESITPWDLFLFVASFKALVALAIAFNVSVALVLATIL